MNVTAAEVVATVGVVPAASKVKPPATEALPPCGAAGNASPYINGVAEGVAETVGVALFTVTETVNATVL